MTQYLFRVAAAVLLSLSVATSHAQPVQKQEDDGVKVGRKSRALSLASAE